MASQARRNSILGCLPAEELGKISRELQTVTLVRDEAVIRAGEKNRYSYFLTSGVISFLGKTGQGSSIEVWSVGHEGTAGLSGILGCEAPFSGVVQIPGSAFRAKTSTLRKHFEKSLAFRNAVGGYLHYL